MSEPQRLALHAAARKVLGEKEGDTLMALSPPANTDMATKQDLDRLEERRDAKLDAAVGKLDARIDKLDAKLDAAVDKLDARIDNVAALILAAMATSEATMRGYVWRVSAGAMLGTTIMVLAGIVGLSQLLA